MTPREAKHAIYAAALAVDQYVHTGDGLKNDALDALDDALYEVRTAELLAWEAAA